MTGRLVLAVIVMAMLAASGCQSDKERDDVDVFLNSGVDYHLGCLVEARVDDLHSGVAKSAGNDLGAAVVTVEPGLRNQHSDPVCHGS